MNRVRKTTYTEVVSSSMAWVELEWTLRLKVNWGNSVAWDFVRIDMVNTDLPHLVLG